MSDNIQHQINEINKKLDILLRTSEDMRRSREETNDLVSDLSLIGKDLYDFSVKKLEEEQVQLNDEVITKIILKFLRDIDIFYEMLNTLENVFDLVKDISPIINQIGRDTIHKLADLEQKGYLEFFKEFETLFDSIVKNFKPGMFILLASKMEALSNLVRNTLESGLIDDAAKFVEAYNETSYDEAKPAGPMKALKTLRKPEMKKKLGFILNVLENYSKK